MGPLVLGGCLFKCCCSGTHITSRWNLHLCKSKTKQSNRCIYEPLFQHLSNGRKDLFALWADEEEARFYSSPDVPFPGSVHSHL